MPQKLTVFSDAAIVRTYCGYNTHSGFGIHTNLYYHAFNISDPKPRNIHKAGVSDRLLHHALHRKSYSFLDRKFISDSYSCRVRKGTHKAIDRFRSFAYRVSKNHTRTVWVLKCDIRKFFASVDQKILMNIVARHIHNEDIVWLIDQVVRSFNSGISGKGLPLGNLTSQLLVNVYMNNFDQFVKHKLKAKHYIRYADDFVIMHTDKNHLEALLRCIEVVLREWLKLKLHTHKVSIETLASGIDFLGWVHFLDHRVLRGVTKRRMLKWVIQCPKDEIVQSYKGLLSHGNSHKLAKNLENNPLFNSKLGKSDLPS